MGFRIAVMNLRTGDSVFLTPVVLDEDRLRSEMGNMIIMRPRKPSRVRSTHHEAAVGQRKWTAGTVNCNTAAARMYVRLPGRLFVINHKLLQRNTE